MKKYCVHMGVRLTKDFYVMAHDENEAESLACEMFENTKYSDMEVADTDADLWEANFKEPEADVVSDWDDDEYKEVHNGRND